MEELREHVTSIFATAPSSNHHQSVGLELESLPLKRSGGKIPEPVDITNDEESGICDILRKTAATSPELEFEPKRDETPQFNTAEGGNISFEPGGQVEYSSSECFKPVTAIEEMVKYIRMIGKSFADNGIDLFHGGINPWHGISEVGLKMQKPRYRAMNDYFQAIGPYGQQMMRLTLSIQVNLDFGTRQTARSRWFAANLLAPVMCAAFGNSPFAGNNNTNLKSYRSFIWQNMDNCRTGFPNPKNLDCPEMDQVDQYLIYALDAYVIKLYHDAVVNGDSNRFVSFRQWMADGHPRLTPDMDEWETHISLLFPEVRPKGFLEFRTLDGPSTNWWTVPIVILSSILYDTRSLELILKLMEPHCRYLNNMMKQAAEKGVSAFPEIVSSVFQIAFNSRYSEIPPELLNHSERFFAHFIHRGRNPADDLLEINNGRVFSLEQYRDHELKSRDILAPPDNTLFD